MARNRARYFVAGGEFTLGEIYSFRGYAGRGEGKNNADFEFVRNVGPPPRGEWIVSVDVAANNPDLARPVLRLTPAEGLDTKGRSGFLIHGDNATGTASRGCIILNRAARVVIAEWIRRNGNLPLTIL